jgi:hypothetical protein
MGIMPLRLFMTKPGGQYEHPHTSHRKVVGDDGAIVVVVSAFVYVIIAAARRRRSAFV